MHDHHSWQKPRWVTRHYLYSLIRVQDEHTIHGNGVLFTRTGIIHHTPQDRVARISLSSDSGLGLAVLHSSYTDSCRYDYAVVMEL